MRSLERQLRFIKINTKDYNTMSLDLRLVNYPCWGELEKDENVTVIEKEESETTSIIYKGEESVFYPITDSVWDCPEPIKATAVNAEFLEYLWQTYGTMWYTDEDSPEYAYDYMMLLKNIRERNDVWEHILLDYWKTAYPDHWDENLEARLNLTRPAFEKSRPSLTAMSRITSSRVYAQFIQQLLYHRS